MPLESGTRLGPYEVTAQIGVGGMGEVYRATDTKLKRQVAVKVLPESVAGDPDRLARFQREAEVLDLSRTNPRTANSSIWRKSKSVNRSPIQSLNFFHKIFGSKLCVGGM